MLKILKTLVAQIDVLETMTLLQFLSFRDRLDSASGFQRPGSGRSRRCSGSATPHRPATQPKGSAARAAVESAQGAPSLWSSFLVPHARGHALADDVLARDVTLLRPGRTGPGRPHRVYRGDADAALVAERLVDLDEGFQEWRYRHVKMVDGPSGPSAGQAARAAWIPPRDPVPARFPRPVGDPRPAFWTTAVQPSLTLAQAEEVAVGIPEPGARAGPSCAMCPVVVSGPSV